MTPQKEPVVLRRPTEGRVRSGLASDPALGAGTVLQRVSALWPADGPFLSVAGADEEGVSGDAAVMTVVDLVAAADRVAAAFLTQQVRPRDVVAVYSRDAFVHAVHYFALTRLGAIPALVNGDLAPADAAVYVERLRPRRVVAGGDLRRELLAHVGAGQAVEDADAIAYRPAHGTGPEGPVLPDWYPYQHAEDDPVLLTHSSGTTGVPKAVLMTHGTLFAAIRYRLRLPRPAAIGRILSALPGSHNSAISLLLLALVNRSRIHVLSDNGPERVLREIGRYRPSMVAAFAKVYAGLGRCDLDRADLSSVMLWWNSGDAAHEPHIRRLFAYGAPTGSSFVDGLGSSEMGHSLFYNIHTATSSAYGRCIGKPFAFVEAAVLSPRGDRLRPGDVGLLGVRSPSITPGYWNDSATTYRSRLGGFWLTGDVVREDEHGRYFHLDRASDVVPTAAGPVYSLLTEEIVLARLGAVEDCTVVGIDRPGVPTEAWMFVVPSGKGTTNGIANGAVDTDEMLRAVNALMAEHGLSELAVVRVVGEDQLPEGPTGKVRKRWLRESCGGSAFSRIDAGDLVGSGYE